MKQLVSEEVALLCVSAADCLELEEQIGA